MNGMNVDLELRTEELPFKVAGGSWSQQDIYHIIFAKCKAGIRSYILSHGGQIADVEDVLHDTYLMVSKQFVVKPQSNIVSVEAMVTTIGQRIWIAHLRSQQKCVSYDFDFSAVPNSQDDEGGNLRMQCYGLYWKHYKALNPLCRKIISSAFKKVKSTTVRGRLEMSSDYYYKKRAMCIKALFQLIRRDPKYKTLMLS